MNVAGVVVAMVVVPCKEERDGGRIQLPLCGGGGGIERADHGAVTNGRGYASETQITLLAHQ